MDWNEAMGHILATDSNRVPARCVIQFEGHMGDLDEVAESEKAMRSLLLQSFAALPDGTEFVRLGRVVNAFAADGSEVALVTVEAVSVNSL